MRSIEPLLRNLAESDPEMDPNFKAQLRQDLHVAARSRLHLGGLSWRPVALVALSGLVLLLVFIPSLALRGHSLLFGPTETRAIAQNPPPAINTQTLNRWLAENDVLGTNIRVQNAGQPAAVASVVGETYFVLRQVKLENGEMVMVLSEIHPPQAKPYQMY